MMRLVLQRVSRASVRVEGGPDRPIGPGLVILVGFHGTDTDEVCAYMAAKAVNLRIFDDEAGNLNRSLLDTGGGCLIVSNFTLYAACRKGRRPSFTGAAPPELSRPLYDSFAAAVRSLGVAETATGEFGAEMQVELCNDGPVTILLDSGEIMPNKE